GAGARGWTEPEEAVAPLDRIALDNGDGTLDLPSRTPQEKQAAFEIIYWRLRAGPEERLRAIIAELARQGGVDAAGLVRSLCLDWGKLRTRVRELGVAIGAHTLSHPMLAKHDRAAAWREIAG